ncbi:MAG: bifunctional 1-(5-phosphoribosyl)-5-((5-phosphoribosylamino)methylideneamino)imidazole-4-carboxamide isomerase/phosphoribosylanthranilate isomerase PriA [Candidatus Ancillula sp.]|jgi:1-(5-phosphoribosyl)-5-[(5-phosphoribosylamino)methylideneamino] imidazole-4-carboxamide isomerase/N-(5'phosphoribosyl)anthranilate isomerase|nr:bifunctional 1-(5-phosphoribosyl)-5-((5-phosphoribosylamino)methylideneamino)imidazole-4-carboxamide isomerase/phosphoribosylanthranilate isomerase PriA [Candidatus Ancillula sp.]
MSYFSLLPAIDVQDGNAVRLLRGEINDKTNYGNPIDVAHEFVSIFQNFPTLLEGGNIWVHLVDLNAAFGNGSNAEVIAEVCTFLSNHNVQVELSGGIRDDDSLERALKLGAARVNIGTAALEDPSWTARVLGAHAEKVGVGLDTRGETLSARGWTKDGGNIWEVAKRLISDGAKRFVITDVTKDGTLQGVNTELLERMAELIQENSADVKITASGGVSKLEDIQKCIELQSKTGGLVDSAIFGKALYAKQFTLDEALSLVENVSGQSNG